MMWGYLMKFVLALAGALSLATAAHAVTYDAFDSFDGTQGAGGFVYLKLPVVQGGMATQLSTSSSCVVTADSCLQDGANLPGVYKSDTTFTEGTYTVPDDRLLAHPGAVNPLAILFVAPEAGAFDFTLSVNILDSAPSGVFLQFLTNAGGSTAVTPIGALNAQNLAVTRTGTINLAQGEIFGFILGHGGSYSNDSVGVNFTLENGGVPEPAAWALMILGFGGAGAMLRRRAAGLAT